MVIATLALNGWAVHPLSGTLKTQSNGPFYGMAPPRPLLNVPNVTAHQSMASVPTLYYPTDVWYVCARQHTDEIILLFNPLDSKGNATSNNTKLVGLHWPEALKMREWKMQERQSMESHQKKYSKAPDEIWLSWLSWLVPAERNSQANGPVNVSTNHRQCVRCQQSYPRSGDQTRQETRSSDKRQTHRDMLCRDLTAMRTRDCSFYVQLAMPSAQRRY